MEVIRLNNIGSTNDYIMNELDKSSHSANAKQRTSMTINENWEGVVVAENQTSGRGMGSNTWESEPGKNLLFSILVHPSWLEASMQYILSMAEALALYDVLSKYTDDISIKWPNDIYWKDKKISGTRIDGNIKGRYMSDMVIGTGININQKVFHSDAPNPVSLFQITGREYDCNEILTLIIERFEHYRHIAQQEWENGKCYDTIHSMYQERLYRNKGIHKYEDKNGMFEAELIEVKANGIMALRCTDGSERSYEFKEVKFII